MFVVNRKRQEVLTDQLDAINRFYEREKHDFNAADFGLLNGEKKYLDYKTYPHTADPENKGLILVYFSDRILNLKAWQIRMNV